MAGQRVILWTGGQPQVAEACQELAKALPVLPAPDPLRRAAHISYRWGERSFDIWASACSLRTAAWGGAPLTWLHCKAMTTAEIKPDEPTGLIAMLIPAAYVTGIGPGPTYRLQGSQPTEDLGVFPPVWPAPASSLPLAEVERALAGLLAPERAESWQIFGTS